MVVCTNLFLKGSASRQKQDRAFQKARRMKDAYFGSLA